MIRIIAAFSVRPESIEEFIATAGTLVAASRAEPGNISYELLHSRQDAGALVLLEAWADDAGVEAHNASHHFTTLVPRLLALSAGDPTITQYEPI